MTHEQVKALDKLIAAVQSGAFLLGAIKGRLEGKAYDAFFGSLDAAKALHEALLPGWAWDVASSDAAAVFHGNEMHGPCELAASTNPARAWLIAILKAYRAKQEAI